MRIYFHNELNLCGSVSVQLKQTICFIENVEILKDFPNLIVVRLVIFIQISKQDNIKGQFEIDEIKYEVYHKI